jgi:hypothetical protein
MKNKEQDGKIPLRRITSMRVISETVEVALKVLKELLNEHPELAPLILDSVKIIAREGNLDFLSQGQDNLRIRVAVLEQHVKDLQKDAEQQGKSLTQQQEKKKADENAVIAETFSALWTGNGRGRRLLPEGIELMHSLFAKHMTNSEIRELSGMQLPAIGRHRTAWEKIAAPKTQSELSKSHNHTQSAVTVADSGVTIVNLKPVKKNSKRTSRSGFTVKIPRIEVSKSQSNEDDMLNIQTDRALPLSREEAQSGSQNSNRNFNKKGDPGEPSFGLTILQWTKMANMLIEWKFKKKQSALTLDLIGKRFGISGDAVKKTYLPALVQAGLLDKDRRITNEEVLEAYQSVEKPEPR